MADSFQWSNFGEPYGIFGPLMTVKDTVYQSAEAGFFRYSPKEQDSVLRVARHVTDFLAQPHPNLGRQGNVCPYLPDSLEKQLCRLTVTGASDIYKIKEAMLSIRDVFIEMNPSSAKVNLAVPGDFLLKAIIVAFPEVPIEKTSYIISTVQKELKPQYVHAGLMIGEFYPGCPEPGLHNPDFRPLQMPIPALAIRHITKFDAPFMLGKAEYVKGYLDIFGEDGRRRIDHLQHKLTANRCPVQGGSDVGTIDR